MFASINHLSSICIKFRLLERRQWLTTSLTSPSRTKFLAAILVEGTRLLVEGTRLLQTPHFAVLREWFAHEPLRNLTISCAVQTQSHESSCHQRCATYEMKIMQSRYALRFHSKPSAVYQRNGMARNYSWMRHGTLYGGEQHLTPSS